MPHDSDSRPTTRDRRVIARLASWFEAGARPMPWRDAPPGRRDPYCTLVSELMLQQTQVARVEPRFERFVDRFPTILALADADEAQVLALWSGLGYYRRARLLHDAARTVRDDLGGEIPRDLGALRALPGVGRYTAGAIASLCFDTPAPAVDGNVARVLARLEGVAPDDPGRGAAAWARAGALSQASDRPGLLTESLIELGATVCTARAPACGACPIARDCRSRGRVGSETVSPPVRREIWCGVLLVRDARGRMLIERRSGSGLWAGLHQAPTIESGRGPPTARMIRSLAAVQQAARVDRFEVLTSHRRVRFDVFGATPAPRSRLAINGRRWLTRREVESVALGSPQRRILLGEPGMLGR